MKYRFESFGGILSLEKPAMLVHVDREFMRSLGHHHSPLWGQQEQNYLSAPLEVHFAVTNACSLRCGNCYMDSGERQAAELSGNDFRKAVDVLAEMGVFHMAMGGGEALERRDFFDLASYARDRGIVPNLTTNGMNMTGEIAAQCRVFGQVNVSIDAIGTYPETGRDPGALNAAIGAVDLLQEAGVNVGINCVVGRQNFEHLSGVFAFVKEHALADVELLRLKPTGRARHGYYARRMTPLQNREFYPAIIRLSQQYGVTTKIDCSFVPMFCWHRPDQAMMEQFSVYGCEAGNVLIGVRSDGRFAGCSFCSGDESILDLPRLWKSSDHLLRLRSWTSQAPEPCRSCTYLPVCKGGCRAVADFVSSDFYAPDPECPFADGMD